jgi:cell division protein FtsA
VKPRSGLVAALDIGSTKIAAFIARIHPEDGIEVIGIGHQLSQGCRGGVVVDMKRAEQSILAAVESAERMGAATIDRVLLNIASTKTYSMRANPEVPIHGQVNDRDIHRLMSQVAERVYAQDREVVHMIPLSYCIDDAASVKDPSSMVGQHLRAQLHVVLTQVNTVINLANCLASCQLDIEELICTPYASGLACLTPDEMELGAIVVDMGGGSTSFAVFKDQELIHTGSIAVGGHLVTSDIAQGLSTSYAHAERIKTLHGNAIITESDEDEMIDVPIIGEDQASGEYHYVSRALIGQIIRPRLEETFELVRDHLAEAGPDVALIKRMVITGGASQLLGTKELASLMFQRHVRLGVPRLLEGMAESTRSPAFSAAVGMLQFAAHKSIHKRYDMEHYVEQKPTLMGRLAKWLQEHF